MIIAIGISIICFSWNYDFFSSVNQLIERENFEAFLNAKVTQMLQSDEEFNNSAVKSDNPKMAALQDYLMTVDPELKMVPKERLKQAYEITKELQKEQLLKSTDQLEWQSTVSDIGGRTRAIMWDPNDPTQRKIWSGGVTGGLWYKENITNDNDPWIPVDDFWPNLAISCMTYDPNDPQTFYVGTGEAQTALIIYRESSGVGFGIMKSTDSGTSWDIIPGTEEFEYVTDIEVRDENGLSVVYAAVASGVYKGAQHLSEPSDGLFRLPEGEENWEQVLPNITDLDVPYAPSDIEIGADGRMYIGTMPNVEGDGGATILYSDDCLTGTWSVNEEYKILIENTPDVNLPGRIILAAAPSDENRVYALVAQGYFYGIPGYECHIITRSDDKGESWEMVSVPPPSGSTGNWAFIAWHALTAAVDPNNPDKIFIGALDLWRSEDAGESWVKRSNWQGTGTNFIHADHHRILFQDGSSDKFLVATDGGVFYTFNASLNNITYTQKNTGLNTLQMYKCAINPESDVTFYLGGMQDNGTKYYDGNPIGNQNHVTGGDGGACFIDKNEPDVFITSHQNNQFYLFGNYQFVGAAFNWQSGNFISSVDYDYKLNTIYANAVTVLNNLPDQILRISGIPYGPIEGGYLNMGTGSNVPFTHVKYSEHSSLGTARLFLGTQAGRMFRVDNANTDPVVTEIGSNNFPSAAISCITHAGSDDTLLVTFSNYGVTSVWQSYDSGQSWDEREGNLPDMPVRWALYHPQHSNSAMLATEIGIWTTYNLHDLFVLWQPDNTGLANVRIDMLQLRDADNTVLAGTHGRGFYTTTYLYDPTTKVNELAYNSPSIYPNPTQGPITIELTNEISEPVDICIYNNDYKKVRTFSFQNRASTAQLDISDLSAGIYYVSINTKQETLTGKIIKH